MHASSDPAKARGKQPHWLCAAAIAMLCAWVLIPVSQPAQAEILLAQFIDPSMPVPQGPAIERKQRQRAPFALPTAPLAGPTTRRRSTPARPSPNQSEEAALPGGPKIPPYNQELLRLSQILGSMHYLRPLCGAEESQTWREQMTALLQAEGADGSWKTQLVNSFNTGFKSFERSYRECTPSATLAVERYMREGSQITQTIKTRYAD